MASSLGLQDNAVQRCLDSPFAPEQLQVLVDGSVDTRFRQRAASLPSLVSAIRGWLDQQDGNCIVYFPSYRYMADCLEQLGELPGGRRLWQQGREQDDAQRAELLQQLRSRCDLAAFCILGGVFGEGVDLPGDQLSSVVIVGVGLPQFNADTEAQRDYFQARYGDGFAYAYLYPGMQKVAQALGRVVRTEQDRGTALLLDSRYRERRYRALLPPAWAYRESLD
jgi:DNA excision repair protein ERCC-2